MCALVALPLLPAQQPCRVCSCCGVQDDGRLPHLVVVPLTTLANWERELETWAPRLRVLALKGAAPARALLLQHSMYTSCSPGSQRSSNLQVRGLLWHRAFHVCTGH